MTVIENQQVDQQPGVLGVLGTLRLWTARRWVVAAGTTVLTFLLIALPTALIENPMFGREVPPTWWSAPALVVSSVLAGLVTASYVASPVDPESRSAQGAQRRGLAGGLLTFFAVGCPVCNKIVLLALGYSGAIAWFQPVQPVLQVGAIALLGWALVQRLRGEASCPVSPRQG